MKWKLIEFMIITKLKADYKLNYGIEKMKLKIIMKLKTNYKID